MKSVAITFICAFASIVIALNMVSCVKQQSTLDHDLIVNCIMAGNVYGPVMFRKNGSDTTETYCHPKDREER